MGSVSSHVEEESKRIFWVIQTIFGFIIARSFYENGQCFIPPFQGDYIALILGFISVYVCILWSWIDYSFTSIIRPYHFKKGFTERIRFIIDLIIVLIYSYLLLYLGYIKNNSDKDIKEFLFAFLLIYIGYILSGILRRYQYGKKASSISILILFAFLHYFLFIIYINLVNSYENKILNYVFIGLTLLFTLAYRLTRGLSKKRKYTIAIDVDGVLADQITGVLPIIKEEYGIELSYEDVTDWKLPINQSSIDKIIVAEQEESLYVLGMPEHKNASEVIDKLCAKFYISVATARPINADDWTKQWLSDHGIYYDFYYNLKEGKKQSSKHPFDILIDDYIGNIENFLKKSNGKAILFSQPWNQDRENLEKYLHSNRLIVVKNWAEVEGAISKLL